MSSNSRLEPLTLNKVLASPAKKWLVKDLIGKKDFGMIYGESGCGKTFLVIDLLFAAALGKKWANRFEINEKLKVAYCAGEGNSGIPARFKAAADKWRAVYKDDGDGDDDQWSKWGEGMQLVVYQDVPLLFSPLDRNGNGIEKLTEFITGYQTETEQLSLDLLVIDTLHSAAIGAEENSAKDAGQVLAYAKKLRDELNCTVLFIHHSNKGNTSERGSSAFRAAMDLMVEVEKQEDGCGLMKYSKSKDAERFDDLHFEVVPSESESAYVRWTGKVVGSSSNKKKKITIAIAVKQYLESHPEQWFTSDEIHAGINQAFSQNWALGSVRNELTKLSSDDSSASIAFEKPHDNSAETRYKHKP